MNSLHNRMNAYMKKNKSEEFADNFLKLTKYLKKNILMVTMHMVLS